MFDGPGCCLLIIVLFIVFLLLLSFFYFFSPGLDADAALLADLSAVQEIQTQRIPHNNITNITNISVDINNNISYCTVKTI